jgi:hypothetical protein
MYLINPNTKRWKKPNLVLQAKKKNIWNLIKDGMIKQAKNQASIPRLI